MEINSVTLTHTYTMKADGFEIFVTDLGGSYTLTILASTVEWLCENFEKTYSGKENLLSALDVLDFNLQGLRSWLNL